MVGAMDPAVAIGATLGQRGVNPVIARCVGVPAELVAAQTQERSLALQHAGVIRTVRVMAVGAVFAGRGMLPQERTPFISVTGVASFIHGGGFQKFGPEGTMRVVTTGTVHLPFPDRHMRGFQKLSPFFQMAAQADAFRVFIDCQTRIAAPLHDVMATVAGDIVGRVRPTLPIGAPGAFMALQADRGFLRRT